MHRMLVEERRWIAEDLFLHVLNSCMLLPGPEAMQLATSSAGGCTATFGGEAANDLLGAIAVHAPDPVDASVKTLRQKMVTQRPRALHHGSQL